MLPSGVTAAVSATDAAIQKKTHASGMTANKEMKDIMKIVKSLQEFSLLIKGFSQTTENETKEQKGGFLNALLGTLAARRLGNMLAGKRVIRAEYIPEEIKKLISNKNIKTNIYRIQANDPRICGYCCIGFIDFLLR